MHPIFVHLICLLLSPARRLRGNRVALEGARIVERVF
jgi:hypothetical protein